MIEKREAQLETIIGAKCDCCNEPIKVTFGRLDEHMSIGGYADGKILEAIVCIPCMKTKLSFINIAYKENTIGYC